MHLSDTKKLYAEDEILSKLEIALKESSGPINSDIRAAIKDRKKKLRSKKNQSTLGPIEQASRSRPVRVLSCSIKNHFQRKGQVHPAGSRIGGMGRTLRGGDGPQSEAGQPLEAASGWDLMDADFTYEFDGQEGLHRVSYDSGQASPSLAIITVVSTITGIDPLELDPLCESIDTDALDAQFTADVSAVSRLTFQYSGCEITVGTDDVVEVVV